MGAPEARKATHHNMGPEAWGGRPAHPRAHTVPADATSRLGRRVPSARACPSCPWGAVGLSPPRGAWPSWAPRAGPRRCRRSVWPSGRTSASRWPSRGPCEQAEGDEWGAPRTPAPRPPMLWDSPAAAWFHFVEEPREGMRVGGEPWLRDLKGKVFSGAFSFLRPFPRAESQP